MPCNRKAFSAVALLAAGLFWPSRSGAQQVFGSIYGTVTESSGAAVPRAAVSIADISKNIVYRAETNDSGNYTKGQLIPGSYRVEIAAVGFRKAISTDLTVLVDAGTRFDATLEVGAIGESVTVTAASPLLQADRADLAGTLTADQVTDLPNYQRNSVSFMFLTPGVQLVGGATPVSENPQGGFRFSVNGQNFGNTGYQLDGTSNQEPLLGNILINPNIDSLAEAKFATEDFDAEFGYVGAGIFTMSTKSGSNQVHGSAFDYLINNTPGFTTFGRNPFSEPLGAQPYKSNQFGGSIGGRVIRDKLFYFGDAQLTRRRQSSVALTTVPTLAARTGDLSGYLANPTNVIYDPATGDPNTGLGRTPFAGNVIPANRISMQAANILKYFPAPNTLVGGVPYRNNYSGGGGAAFNAEQWDTRWDYYARSNDIFFGRFTYGNFNNVTPGVFGLLAGGTGLDVSGFSGQSASRDYSLALGYTHTFNSTAVNEFRFGFLRYKVDVTPNGYGTQPATDAGIPGLNLDKTFTSGLPAFNIGGDGGALLGYSLTVNRCNCPLAENERQFQFVDNFSKTIGNHALKFGVDGNHVSNLRVPSDQHRSGELGFAPGYTAAVDANGATRGGLGIATFLLGQVTSFSRYVSTNLDAEERQNRVFWYAQDTWRVTPKLTVSYGLRWEWIFPETVNKAGNGGALDLSTGLINVLGIGKVPLSGLAKNNWNAFAPRLGVAYQLTPKTVLRAGYGISYALGVFGSVFGHDQSQNLPVLAIQSDNPANAFSGVFTLAQGPKPPTFVAPDANGQLKLPNGVTARARPNKITLPQVQAYNLSLQRQITSSLTATFSYVGNSGRHAINGVNSNTIDVNQAAFVPGVPNQNLRKPYFSKYGWTQPITFFCNCANNTYNAFQAKVESRNFHGLTVGGSYNYQVAVGDSGNSYTFLYNRPLGYGNASAISRNQVIVSTDYELPFGKGRKWGANWNRAVDAGLGGWRVSGVTSFFSGLPFTATIGTYPSTVNGVSYTHPDVGPSYPDRGTGDPYQGAKHDRSQWFKGGLGSTFLLPAANTFGNYGFNNLWGPIYINQDIALAKSITLREKTRLTLRADAYNVFNHTNLSTPNANLTDVAAGQITGLAYGAQMRRMQFALRLDF